VNPASLAADKLRDLRKAIPALDAEIRSLQKLGRVVVFGGFVRDALHESIHGEALPLRDIDLVVDGSLPNDPADARNHFGGSRRELHGGLKLDCWALSTTLAFRRDLVPARLENLVGTTVYTINGCYLDIASGALNAETAVRDVQDRTIAFNCRGYLDTYPEYQAFRAIDLAERLRYSLQASVDEFVKSTLRGAGVQAFTREVRAHRPTVGDEVLERLFQKYAA
jgi:hypothetical protein